MSISLKVASWAISWLLAAGTAVGVNALAGHGDGMATLAGMTTGEISTLHAALFLATVWIVSSLRIHRLGTLWRVGFGLTVLRGASGGLRPRGPKARAATGGSVDGAGTSGIPGGARRAGNDAGRRHDPGFANDNGGARQVLDNFGS